MKHQLNVPNSRNDFTPDLVLNPLGWVHAIGVVLHGRWRPLTRSGPGIRNIFFLLAFFFGVLQGQAAPPQFEKLLAFSGSEQVRVSAQFQPGDEAGDIELIGRILKTPGDALLWEGLLGKFRTTPGAVITISNTVTGLKPDLWSPDSPTLYHLEILAQRDGRPIATKRVRFGFRSFEIRDGKFQLNGQPIFLRGVAINPPGRGIPENVGETRKFAEDYVRFLKSQNLNIFRLSTDESQVWFDVCDELGMMLYAGRYGALLTTEAGKKRPPKDFEKSLEAYKTLFEGYASHPSIVEYYLSNELPHTGKLGASYSAFLERLHTELKKWDSTRPYIGNAGYGEGREGDVCDVHRYWGWYYNSFLTYYNLRDRLYPEPLFGDPKKNQPLTFTECVGSFTGSSGQFNVVRSKQLAPSLGWIGHTDTPREDALAYQAFMTQQACESFRRMRPLNPRLAGIMPFTILFYNWSGISSFDEMKPKPVMDAMRTAFQPILLSWELWTPQVYAGSTLDAIAHIVNDDDQKRDLNNAILFYSLQTQDRKEVLNGRVPFPPILYYGTWNKTVSIRIPPGLPSGTYRLSGSVQTQGQTRSTNTVEVFIAGKDWDDAKHSFGRSIGLYDPKGETASALAHLKIPFTRITNLGNRLNKWGTLIIAARTWDWTLSHHQSELQNFARQGGRILVLQPDVGTFQSDWLPQKVTLLTSSPNAVDYPPLTRPFREQMNINLERPDHDVFRGLNRHQFSLWSDYSNWNQTKPGFPQIYPVTSGFRLDDPGALEKTAILADYDRGLEGIALCEMFDGKGSVILSGFDLVNRTALDPVADRLLVNLVAYAASKSPHEIHPLIEKPIRWGDYPTERGVAPGSLNGLLVNAEWIRSPANPNAKPMAPNTGAWNMNPGEQFEPRGRNPFGTYGYSTASSLRDPNPDAKTGEGFFWVRIPNGKKMVITTVKNPTRSPARLQVFVGREDSAGSAEVVPPGQSVVIRTPLKGQTGSTRIRYAGEKTLVLVETDFQ